MHEKIMDLESTLEAVFDVIYIYCSLSQPLEEFEQVNEIE